MLRQTVIFIDTPGLYPVLKKSLEKIGLDADIITLDGQIYSNPKTYNPVGLNETFKETMRNPVDKTSINRIARAVNNYKYFILATEPDQEGDSLASEIASLLPVQSLLRVNISGLDPASLAESLDNLNAYHPHIGWIGTTRRLVDRAIEASLSSVEAGVKVGRLRSALLGAISHNNVPHGELRLSIKDELGGHEFECRLDLDSENSSEVRYVESVAHELKDIASAANKRERIHFKPWSYAECLSECAHRLSAPVSDVADALNRLYASGYVTYPKSNATSLSVRTIKILTKISDAHGHRHPFNADSVTHNALEFKLQPVCPLIMVDVSKPIKLLSFDDAVLALITRQLILCGTECYIETAHVSHLPAWAKGYEWRRLVHPALSWQDSKLTGSHANYRKDVALVRTMIKFNIGNPNEIVNEVSEFIQDGLIDNSFELNEKGVHCLLKTPDILRDPETFNKIENVICNHTLDPAERAYRVISMLGDDVCAKIMDTISTRMKALA